MTPAAFEYHAPRSLAEALHLLESGHARPLAGGQSLVPSLVSRALCPPAIVDLNRILDLPGIECRDKQITTGPLVRMQHLMDHETVARLLPLLTGAISQVGHRAIRNRATVAGSLCQLDSWAELPVAASALDATLLIAGTAGTRRLPFSEFAVAPNQPALSSGELVIAVDWPLWPAGHGAGFAEVSRRPNDPALACAAALVVLDRTGYLQRIALSIGAVTPLPIRCRSLEADLMGRAAADVPALVRDRIAADLAGHPVRDDTLADATYRRHLAPIVAVRALEQALSGAHRHA